jgi:protoheme IX farnesyltransferase
LKATADTKRAPLELNWIRVADYVELFKVRLNLLVLVTTSMGYYLGSRGEADLTRLLHTLLGTALVAASGGALNQLIEKDIDGRMRRTANRPLPSGRLQPAEVRWLGATLGLCGLLILALSTSVLCTLVAAFTLFSYVFVYTPLKQKTPLAVLVGAVPGALPPVIGWTSARDSLGGEGWVLFGILFLWQLPHFLAIAWLYRQQYARAGLPVLATLDPDGRRTGVQVVLWCSALLAVSLLPTLHGLAGTLYLGGAVLLGAAYLLAGLRMAQSRTEAHARWLFRISLLYLPLLLGLMVYDRLPV